jgi:hypothetical protein
MVYLNYSMFSFIIAFFPHLFHLTKIVYSVLFSFLFLGLILVSFLLHWGETAILFCFYCSFGFYVTLLLLWVGVEEICELIQKVLPLTFNSDSFLKSIFSLYWFYFFLGEFFSTLGLLEIFGGTIGVWGTWNGISYVLCLIILISTNVTLKESDASYNLTCFIFSSTFLLLSIIPLW